MHRLFRKYHRFIAPIAAVPLSLTVLSGMAVTINDDSPINLGLSSSLLLKIHTGEIFHLESIYPLLNGLGLIGLLVTGLSMTSLFSKKKRPSARN